MPPKMFLPAACAAFLAVSSGEVRADRSRDEAIFGESPPVTPQPTPSERPTLIPKPKTSPDAFEASPSSPSLGRFSENLQIGGRLDWGVSMFEKEGTARTKGELRQLKRADLYFDSRPEETKNPARGPSGLRGLLRLRFVEESSSSAPPSSSSASVASESSSREPSFKTLIDEFWLRAVWQQRVFFTLGRQHLKWGSGRFWNPTDFTARESRDPFALFDARRGQDLIKIHVPFEGAGHNLYVILDTEQSQRSDDVAFLTRGEFSMGESAELALSLKKIRQGPDQLGLDWSGAIGPLDLYAETSFSRRSPKIFYETPSDLDPSEGSVGQGLTLPSPRSKNARTIRQSVVGFQHTFKYTDDDTITGVVEYFDNGFGYDKRDLELYALVRGGENPLSVGKRALGVFVQAPSPGSLNDLSLGLSGIKNLIDSTATLRLSATYSFFKELSLQTYVNRCFGDYGALCFRLPESLKSLANDPRLSAEERSILARTPSQRTLTALGFNLIMQI